MAKALPHSEHGAGVVLEAYLDESGIHEGARVCTVGGFSGRAGVWRKVESEWNNILLKAGIQEFGFHSRQFFPRDDQGRRLGPYRHWTDENADRFLDALVQVVLRNRIFPLAHGIVVRQWHALPLETRKWLSGAKFRDGKFVTSGSPNKSYYLPFHFCVLGTAKHSGPISKVHFFVGLDKTFSGYARVLFEQIRNQEKLPYRHLLGDIDFPLSKQKPGLQAADLLVYQLYQHNRARFAGPAGMRPLLRRLLKNRKPAQHAMLLQKND